MKTTTNKIKTTIAGVAALFAVFVPSFVSAQESTTYTVKEGDTLSEIAETYNTTVEKLAENNHIENIHLIYVGQELVIDGPVAPAPRTYKAPAAQNEAVSAPVAATTEVAQKEAPVASAPAEAVAPTPAAAPVELYADLKQKLKNGLLKKNQAVATQRQTDVTVHGQLLKNSG